MDSHTRNLRLYYAGIVSALLFLVLLFIKTSSTFEPFSFRPFGLYVFVYFAVVLIGAFTSVQLFRYYEEFRSPDYLILSFIIFNTTVLFFMGQMYIDFLSNMIVTGQTFLMQPFFGIIIIYILHLGWTFFMLYTINVYGWSNYHVVEKVIIIFFLYLRSAAILMEIERTLSIELFFMIETPVTIYLLIFPLFTDPAQFWTIYLFLVTALPWLIPIYSYIRLPSTSDTAALRRTRYLWIAYSVIIFSVRLAETFVTGANNSVLRYNIWAYGLLLSTLVIAYTLVFFPESLLLTTGQLFRAKRLYKVIETEKSDHSFLGDYHSRISQYVNSLPTDVKQQLEAMRT
ncbi:MAG: hypothetical protein ACXAE3_11500 [Candidatus Kariarchaeaceae archaeon]|jgi:hypothetical protein